MGQKGVAAALIGAVAVVAAAVIANIDKLIPLLTSATNETTATRRHTSGRKKDHLPSSATRTDGRSAPRQAVNANSDEALILNFLAVECEGCNVQAEAVENVRRFYANSAIRFVNVVRATPEEFATSELAKRLSDVNAGSQLALDPAGTVAQAFEVNAFPTIVIVGRTGKVEAVNVGGSGEPLERRIALLFDCLRGGVPPPRQELPAGRRPSPATKLISSPAPAFTIETVDGSVVSNVGQSGRP